MDGGGDTPGINSSGVQKTITLELVSKFFFFFPSSLFLQALGTLGINNKFVLEALWQVVSLRAAWNSGKEERGSEVCRGWEHGYKIRLPGVPGKVRSTVVW